jgi:hypothetical protein
MVKERRVDIFLEAMQVVIVSVITGFGGIWLLWWIAQAKIFLGLVAVVREAEGQVIYHQVENTMAGTKTIPGNIADPDYADSGRAMVVLKLTTS